MNLLEVRKSAAQKRQDALNAALEPAKPKSKPNYKAPNLDDAKYTVHTDLTDQEHLSNKLNFNNSFGVRDAIRRSTNNDAVQRMINRAPMVQQQNNIRDQIFKNKFAVNVGNKPEVVRTYDVIDTPPETKPLGRPIPSRVSASDTKPDDFSDNLFSNKMKKRTSNKGYKAFNSDMNLMRDVSPERQAGVKPSGRSFDMNLLANREGSMAYKERENQRLKQEKSAELLRQAKLSREADKESYQKIKNFIKPHMKRILKKAATRNYWSKDIKPVLGTIADALRR